MKLLKAYLHGVEVWVDPEEMKPGNNGPLVPPHHVGACGHLDIVACFAGDSYAHAMPDGTIKRYSVVIGNKSDLVYATMEMTA